MLKVVEHGKVFFVTDGKVFWKNYFLTYARAVGCIDNLEKDWQSDPTSRDRDLITNFFENRKECKIACSR